MNFTLYIDESGDFESSIGQWVISGFLVEGSHKQVDKKLNGLYQNFPKKNNVDSIKSFHLTDFRRIYGHTHSISIARSLFKELDKLNLSYHFVTSINVSKTIVIGREKTYRTMVLDMMTCLESILGEDQELTQLDLVVASRTINGVRQTSFSDIYDDVLRNLPSALEVDLTTKGIVDLLGNKIDIYLAYANDHWGLVIADFIANISYNNKYAPEVELLQQIESEKKYTSLISFSSHKERRANAAERDKDYSLAIFRWLIIYASDSSSSSEESLYRCFHKLFKHFGLEGSRVSFEIILDKCWRLCKPKTDFDFFVELLLKLKHILNNISFLDVSWYIFRSNIFILKVLNHLGRVNFCIQIIDEQKSILNKIATNPDNISMIMEFNLVETEVYYNNLQLDLAAVKAEKAFDLAKEVSVLSSLILESSYQVKEVSSRHYIKAKMNYLRLKSISNIPIDDAIVLKAELFELEPYLIPSDHSRFRSIYCNISIKLGRYIEAVDYIAPFVMEGMYYDMAAFLRSVCFCILNKISIIKYERLIGFIEKTVQVEKMHPKEIVYRYLAIYNYFNGDIKKSCNYLKKSERCMSYGSSNIANYFMLENNLLHNLFVGKDIAYNDFAEFDNFPTSIDDAILLAPY